MTTGLEIRTASGPDADTVLQTITLGFACDPVARWIWPEPDVYLSTMPKFAKAFGGNALRLGTADVEHRHKAASLWLSPGTEPDSETIDRIFADSVRGEISRDLEALFAQMDAFHPDGVACWYLPMIAADPAFIGQGLGSALLELGLRRCDEAGEIAYLESSNPKNLTLYRRHGFEHVGEIQAGSSPKMFPMVRQPKAQPRT